MIERKLRNTALLVATCFFMENLDGNIATTAVSQIGESLNTTPASVGLVITAYPLTLAVLISVSGWLTQRFGSRPICLSAIAIFTMASLAGALGIVVAQLAVTSAVRWGEFLPGDGLANAYSFEFLVLAGIALVKFLLSTRTPRTAGDNLRRR